MNTDLDQHHATSPRRPSPPLVGLAALVALLRPRSRATGRPALEHVITAACSVAVGLAVLAGLGRWPGSRGNAARTPPTPLAAAAWRAQHMPHRHRRLHALPTRRRDAATGGGVMWAATGWVIATWLRVTLVLAAAVGVAWLTLGAHSGGFWLACAAAVAR